jgi:hypothetical protein
MESKEQIYKELVREAKSANAKLRRLRGHYGEHYGWAGKRLIDKLSIDAVNTVSDKGYIRFNKNLSTVQMKATLKALKEFKSSKTSTVKGVAENIEKIKTGLGSSFDIDSETAQRIFDFFETDKYNLSDEVKYEIIVTAIEIGIKKRQSADVYLKEIKNYIDYGNDADLKATLKEIFEGVVNGTIDFGKMKDLKGVYY